jgi:transcriptional regulator with XRE-family HTH domain
VDDVATELPRDIGGFIKDLRSKAGVSLRQLAEQAGVSNPYLSQIERGLRKPSAEVLQQIASALRVSTPMMYLRAGLLDAKDGPGVIAAITGDTELTLAQKQSLIQIYETFRRENARGARDAEAESDLPAGDPPAEGQPAGDSPAADQPAGAPPAADQPTGEPAGPAADGGEPPAGKDTP